MLMLAAPSSLPVQHSFTEAVKLYDVGDYEGAIVLFEEALVEYYRADVECRALCQGPQKFEGHDHVQYRYSLHELISGKSSSHLSLRNRTVLLDRSSRPTCGVNNCITTYRL